ncbi:hypothetical protein D922_03708 [Enterococcus faecalis 06-MB-DW-09]|nr:hypothetical protein D922_03708 [Enterococcus faecalis 06-MB-DW-09]
MATTNTDFTNFFLSFDRKAVDLFSIKEIVPRHLSDVLFFNNRKETNQISFHTPFMINTKQIIESVILLFPQIHESTLFYDDQETLSPRLKRFIN